MKAELEPKDVTQRGVIITAETLEEEQILLDIWCEHGRMAAFTGRKQIQLTVSPDAPEITREDILVFEK